jgi:hypothetical protein
VRGYYARTGKYHHASGSGRSGGWWTYGVTRSTNGISITPELPTTRTVGWNVGLIVVEVAASLWAHSLGASWLTILGTLGAVLALGIAGLAYVVLVAVPRSQRRHEALLRTHLTAQPPPEDDARPSVTDDEDGTSTGRAA